MSIDLPARLAPFLRTKFTGPVRIRGARRLPGGASRVTWSVTVQGLQGQQSFILRMDGGGVIQDDALSREEEFRLLEAAHTAGIRVPKPLWVCTDQAVLGA